MAMNEFGDDVPDNIVVKARKAGCIKCPKYVYKDGEYGEKKLPAASIGCQPAARRFQNPENAEEMKVDLGDGWVAFESRTASMRDLDGSVRRLEGKGRDEPCIICGEDRHTDDAHFPKPQAKGGTEVIPLCPTHHKLLDNGQLSFSEMKVIWQSRYSHFKSFEEFMKWVYDKGYPYSIEDIRNKKLWKDFGKKEVCYMISNSLA